MRPEPPLPTVFSYDRAAALLPEVRQITQDAVSRVEAARAAGEGPSVDERVQTIVADWAEAMIARGLEVKGLWLVDFDNGSGYYCWRYPEAGLDYFHTYEEGFRGRMRIQ
jgi:hypothetical protein